MLGKVKDDEAESVRIFVTLRSVVFFKVRSVRFVIRAALYRFKRWVNRLRNGREEDERNGGIGNQKCVFQSVIF